MHEVSGEHELAPGKQLEAPRSTQRFNEQIIQADVPLHPGKFIRRARGCRRARSSPQRAQKL